MEDDEQILIKYSSTRQAHAGLTLEIPVMRKGDIVRALPITYTDPNLSLQSTVHIKPLCFLETEPISVSCSA